VTARYAFGNEASPVPFVWKPPSRKYAHLASEWRTDIAFVPAVVATKAPGAFEQACASRLRQSRRQSRQTAKRVATTGTARPYEEFRHPCAHRGCALRNARTSRRGSGHDPSSDPGWTRAGRSSRGPGAVCTPPVSSASRPESGRGRRSRSTTSHSPTSPSASRCSPYHSRRSPPSESHRQGSRHSSSGESPCSLARFHRNSRSTNCREPIDSC